MVERPRLSAAPLLVAVQLALFVVLGVWLPPLDVLEWIAVCALWPSPPLWCRPWSSSGCRRRPRRFFFVRGGTGTCDRVVRAVEAHGRAVFVCTRAYYRAGHAPAVDHDVVTCVRVPLFIPCPVTPC